MADLAPLFYDLVRRLVDRTGSQTTVAHATGLSTSYISKIIRNEVGPDIRPTTVAGALSALGYTVDDLVNGVDIDIPTTVPGQARKAGRKHRKAPRRAPSFAEGDDVEVIRFRDQPHLFMDFISETIDTENAPMVLILALARSVLSRPENDVAKAIVDAVEQKDEKQARYLAAVLKRMLRPADT